MCNIVPIFQTVLYITVLKHLHYNTYFIIIQYRTSIINKYSIYIDIIILHIKYDILYTNYINIVVYIHTYIHPII
jgi:hypothetical protein